MSTPTPNTPLARDMSDAEIAAVDFTPWNRDGACPVPTACQFDEMKKVAPWLRIGFLFMTLDRERLADALAEMSEDDLDSLEDVVRTTQRNCRALADMCDGLDGRMMIAYAVLVQRKAAQGGQA
ncbi:hypothetical protein MKK75_17990 [Methylobacterium sp. J-030]|uniref:hypothetical protein n=1 Tax=Methylobacterium sp. J-030 TaxID=2836627 RepID=UPI001FB88211|nr:hypothetical protein [Methylobacterium sp. J-030]MCJ2070659.1 hypothetical protein [Methylobacterium sp. J-030]